jgi:DNA mismatch repair protein MutS
MSIAAIPRLRLMLGEPDKVRSTETEPQAPLLRSLLAELDDLADVRDLIERTLTDEPGAFARDGGFTRDGIDAELDELKSISRNARQVIAEMEEREARPHRHRLAEGPFNRVFGYYIEISKSNLHAVPADYQRKQTIAGGERFTTAALKEYEEKVLGADERILERELEIFESLRASVAAEAPRIQDHGAGRSPRSTCWPGSPRPLPSPTSPSRTSTTATSSSLPTRVIRSSSGSRQARLFPTTST